MVAVGPGEVVDEPGRWRKALGGKNSKEARFVNLQNRCLIESLGWTWYSGLILRFHGKVTTGPSLRLCLWIGVLVGVLVPLSRC